MKIESTVAYFSYAQYHCPFPSKMENYENPENLIRKSLVLVSDATRTASTNLMTNTKLP